MESWRVAAVEKRGRSELEEEEKRRAVSSPFTNWRSAASPSPAHHPVLTLLLGQAVYQGQSVQLYHSTYTSTRPLQLPSACSSRYNTRRITARRWLLSRAVRREAITSPAFLRNLVQKAVAGQVTEMSTLYAFHLLEKRVPVAPFPLRRRAFLAGGERHQLSALSPTSVISSDCNSNQLVMQTD